MAATELTRPMSADLRSRAPAKARRRPGSELVAVLTALWLLTALGGLAGHIAPGLAPGGGPHPTLRGNVTDMLSILGTNLRLLAVPFALALLGFQRSRRAQGFGDLLVGAVVTVNALRVGLALGRYGTELIPYIPQLPIEWLALALSTSAWMSARRGAQPRELRTTALLAVLAAVTSASIEVLLTPHTR
jgi:hypothetical protein